MNIHMYANKTINEPKYTSNMSSPTIMLAWLRAKLI